MSTLSQYRENRHRKQEGVSTVIAALFLVIILFSILAFIYLSLNRMGRTISIVNNALERKSAENQLRVEVLRVKINSTGFIVEIENTGYRTIGLVKYYIRDKDDYKVITGNLNSTILPGETREILLPGNFNPDHNYIIVLIDTYGGTIRTTYPYIPPPSPGPSANTTITHIPLILEGYTVAVKGYNTTNVENSTYNTYHIITGGQSSYPPLNISSKQLSNQVFPDYSQWKYYKKIVIKENTGHDLTDYTIPIILNSTNFDFTKAKPDGSDIRFITPENKILNYWIQYWNSTVKKALIWIKLNLTGGENTTIYMLYGNPNAIFDTEHYGITKIMAKLPLNDGPNYFIYYMPYIMSANLFNPNQGVINSTMRGDDGSWPYNLNFNFPFYNSSFSDIYISSNGFISNTIFNDWSWNSTKERFFNHEMISPFWADLRTDKRNTGIFINSTYSDYFGTGALFRWETVFYKNNGHQEFDVILYNNGLIRMDYGDITGKPSSDFPDHSPIVGVSLGDNSHYTILTPNNQVDPNDWSNHNSVLYWPRKNATVPPTVYLYPEGRGGFLNEPLYQVSVDFEWNVSPAFVYRFFMNVSVNGIGKGWYNFTISLVWNNRSNVIDNFTFTSNTPHYILHLENSINRFFNTNPIGVLVNITSNVSFFVVFENGSIMYGHPNDPIIGVVSNSSGRLWIYRVRDGSWFNYTIPGGLGNYASIVYDKDYGRFVLVNGSHLMVFYPENQSFPVTSVTSLKEPVGDGGFVVSVNGYSIYAPGGGSSSYYVYNGLGRLVSSGNFSEPVTPYTCTAVNYDNNLSYVYFGLTGDIYRLTLDAYGDLFYERITVDPASPTGYPVGLDYYGGKLWVISRGGGISIIDLSSGSVSSLSNQLPYYPMTEGDRMVYVNGNLYHVREDGTSEMWIIPVG